jgi:hypothetical protein
MKNKITFKAFKAEMDQFFMLNRFTEQEREEVKAWPIYRRAAEDDDAAETQEIAIRFQEAKESSVSVLIKLQGVQAHSTQLGKCES